MLDGYFGNKLTRSKNAVFKDATEALKYMDRQTSKWKRRKRILQDILSFTVVWAVIIAVLLDLLLGALVLGKWLLSFLN